MNHKITPVDAFKHSKDTRLDIPTSERAGEEAGVVDSMQKQSSYSVFRHDFTRGRDPELYWLGKYDNDDEETQSPDLKVDIRSLYVHEDIRPEMLINNLYRIKDEGGPTLFGNLFEEEAKDELERIADYYQHSTEWKNRLIQGDSLLVMNSLLNREGMAGKVQCIYIDPPYGIKYGSNWQMKLNSRDVKDNDQNISGEPEMIKAFRDTWELGIHSYLSYLRDRLVVARELLTQSGSVFVQISDENVHLVRNCIDEVFGSENFFALITFKKTSPLGSAGLAGVSDYIIWYAKDKENIKYRQLYEFKGIGEGSMYKFVELENGERRPMTKDEQNNPKLLPKNSYPYRIGTLFSAGYTPSCMYDVEFNGEIYKCSKKSWMTNKAGMERLISLNRVEKSGSTLGFVRYHKDFPVQEINNLWADTAGATNIQYVVQTSEKVIQRCILMSTDPGDLVLDPTCGGGTTAYVAEQWGRRWITIDTSRIALNIAKKRLSMAVYPFYDLYNSENIRQGFKYKNVPHITVKTLAQNEDAHFISLYDQPQEDKKKIRVSGPFTVETLQSFNVVSPDSIDVRSDEAEENRVFQERIFSHLQTSGIRNGDKSQKAIFHGVEPVASPFLHAKGYYKDESGTERLVYFHIGPKFGTVSKQAVNRAVQDFRAKLNEGASWLVLLGFSFEDSISDKDYNLGVFTVSKVRMHDDLMQDGLLKKDKGAGSFITIGEPDIAIVYDDDKTCHVEIRGLDIYDPIKDLVKSRSIEDIAYWEIDKNYNGSSFIVSSMHFTGGDKKEYAAWRKGLDTLVKSSAKTKKKAESTLRIEINDEFWDTLYTHSSEPIERIPGKKIAVRVISQFGEESSKILNIE